MVELSVVIPTYNRAEQLRACLESLCHQTQPVTDYEVIVVVDGSTDGTPEMLASLKTSYSLHVIRQPNRGQAAARNSGVAAASGQTLIFVDDDLVAAPTLVTEHLRLHRERKQVVGVGQLILTLPQNAHWFAQHYAQDWHEHYKKLNQGSRPPRWDDCYGGNMSVAKTAYLEVGGYDESLWRSNDMDLAYRLERHGCEFVYLAQALGRLDERKSFRNLASDFEKSGYHSVRLYQRYPATLARLIGFFAEYKLTWILLWRLLLCLDISPLTLDRLRRLLGRRTDTQNWYRFLARYCLWRGVRHASPDRDFWRDLTYGTPILMYHAFGAQAEPASRYVIPVRRFARQMGWLRRMGYRVLSLEEYLNCRHQFRLPPARSVVITIDDGYKDNLTLAYPILRRHGIPATIFLVSNQLGGTYHYQCQSELKGRRMLSWEDTKEMMQGGIKFGAHTRTHPDLTKILPAQAREEIEGSKLDLERELGAPVRVFSYPHGECNAEIQALVQQAGFVGSCSVKTGLNTPVTPLHALRRVEIDGTISLVDFALAVRFGERTQTLWKRFSLLVRQLLNFGIPDKFQDNRLRSPVSETIVKRQGD